MQSCLIDGEDFSTLDEFFDVIGKVLIPGVSWGRNLDAFDDILRGGFGTPVGGFELVWRNSAVSRARLGYAETQTYLLNLLPSCHPANIEHVRNQIADAQNETGGTIFDWVVEVFHSHGPSGEEAADNVILRLE